MGKLRSNKVTPNVFELKPVKGRRGIRMKHVPIRASPLRLASSRNGSPSKKRRISPGLPTFEDETPQHHPKQTKRSGKVRHTSYRIL